MSGLSDKVNVRNGADFSFVCSKIPFAISCLSDMASHGNNLIDLDLVNKMRIPLTNIKVTRMIVSGQSVRSVGFINQTVQCVRRGKVTGTIHLQARVIRDLYTLFDVDCVASSRTYTKLMGRKPPDPSEDDHDEESDDENIPHYGDLDDPVPITNNGADDNDMDEMKDQGTNDDEDDNKDEQEDEEDDAYINYPVVWNTAGLPDDFVADVKVAQRVYPHHQQPRPVKKKQQQQQCQGVDSEQVTCCDLCYHNGQPISVILSHPTLSLDCPLLTDQERKQIIGSVGDRR